MTNTRESFKMLNLNSYTQNIKKGEIYFADLDEGFGSEQGGNRPVIVIQNNIGNKYSPTVIVSTITSRDKKPLPTHVYVDSHSSGLMKNSTITLEQIRTVDKARLKQRIGKIDNMQEVDKAIMISFGINMPS